MGSVKGTKLSSAANLGKATKEKTFTDFEQMDTDLVWVTKCTILDCFEIPKHILKKPGWKS